MEGEKQTKEAPEPLTWKELLEKYGGKPAKGMSLRKAEEMTGPERADEFLSIMENFPPELLKVKRVRNAIRSRLEALAGEAIEPRDLDERRVFQITMKLVRMGRTDDVLEQEPE